MKNKFIWFPLIAIATLSIALVSADPQDFGYGGMMGMMYGQYGIGFGILSWVTSLLVITLIVAAIYWLVKSANRKK